LIQDNPLLQKQISSLISPELPHLPDVVASSLFEATNDEQEEESVDHAPADDAPATAPATDAAQRRSRPGRRYSYTRASSTSDEQVAAAGQRK